MYRQGKYTRRRGPVVATKRFLKRRWQWWKALSLWKKIAVIAGPIVAFLIIVPIVTYFYYYNDIGNIDRLLNRNNTGVVLMDRNGKVFFSTGRAEHRTLVPLDQISDNMKHALIASEDKDFYNHGGFSPLSTVRAMYTNILAGGITGGGSTITQQLAKNTLLSTNQTFLRKYQELTIAMAIEQRYSKDQILDMYLNSVFYGENSFGIEEAASTYFGKTPAQLDLAESAMLVGVLPAPSAYSPISGNPTYAKERQKTVLDRMVKNGYITADQETAAIAEELHYAPQKPAIDNEAPHFTEMVLDELYKKYGEETVKRSGFQVKTTLDLTLQKSANKAVADNMRGITANGGSNAGLIAIDPKTGGILAMVGSADYNNTSWGKVNMTITPRQPGSSFKPIYYSDALARGLISPSTVLDDSPKTFDGNYAPLDYDKSFRGKVTVRQALDWSLNIPAVEVMQKESISSAVDTAHRMGISTVKSADNYGLALALGVAEAPLDQMTNAYAAFGNGGDQYATTSIASIADKYNSTIFTASHQSQSVVSPQGAFLISSILSDNQTRARMFGSSLNVTGTDGRTKTVAVKTGTTEDNHDAWTIGYTPDIAAGVWVGNNDNTAMYGSGGEMAGPVWREFMKEAVGTASPSFVQPAGITKSGACSGIGLSTDFFLSSNTPSCSVPSNQQSQPSDNQQQPQQQQPLQAMCTVAGKQTLTATDPNCKEDMCTIPGKENYAANDPKCVKGNGNNTQCQNGTLQNTVNCSVNQTPVTSSP